MNRPYIKVIIKNVDKEVGINELIERFKLKYPDSPHVNMIFDAESSWMDVAIEAVKIKIQPTDSVEYDQSPQAEVENYFLSMVEILNEVRCEEYRYKLEKMTQDLEEAIDNIKNPTEEQKMLRDGTWMLPDYKRASSRGCMLLIPIIIGICSTLCCIIGKLIG